MSDREIVYLHSDGTVANVVVIGTDNPDDLLTAYGYAEWVDRADTPAVSMGWQRVNGEWRPPAPFPSWTWSDGDWTAPVPRPEGDAWVWDEDRGAWVDPTAPPGE